MINKPIETGLSPIELAFIETTTWDLKKLCDVYAIPSELITGKWITGSLPDNKSESDEPKEIH